MLLLQCNAIKIKTLLLIFSTSIYKLFPHKMSHLTLKKLYEVVATFTFIPVLSKILSLVEETSSRRVRAPMCGCKVVKQQDTERGVVQASPSSPST